jgi:hypothetical protein
MRFLSKFLAVTTFLCSTAAHAGLISGFENGMLGWQYIGDVSVQNSSIGLPPTQGHNFVFLTTLSMTGNTTGPEPTYSGTDSPSSYTARAFLGIQTVQPPVGDPYMAGFPMVDPNATGGGYLSYATSGESAAIKTQFTVNRPGFVSFDWDRVGEDGDNAYFTIWNDDLGSRINGWIYDPHTYTDGFTPVDVGLCSHTTSVALGCGFYNAQTGWHTLNVWIGTPGTYTIGFGMNEIDEGTVPTILALDNVRFNVVPEPSSTALIGLAMAGLAFARRRKA